MSRDSAWSADTAGYVGMKIKVEPSLLQWARVRAALAPAELAHKVGLKQERVTGWEKTGELELTHLERIAEKTHTPIGYLFLPEPPQEALPVADFRRQEGGHDGTASPDLLETLYLCQHRQAWYREHLITNGRDALSFIGKVSLTRAPIEVATDIRSQLDLIGEAAFAALPTWGDALRALYDRVEALGVLVMRNGVVGNNTHRKLSVAEFRGFALSDQYAPVVFVNAADSKSAQMFTVIHELAHLWLGQSGVSDVDPNSGIPSERFCNAVAAEVLVPMSAFVGMWSTNDNPQEEAQRLARHFKVSPLVMLIRAREAGILGADDFEALYRAHRESARTNSESSGGDFYRTQSSRLGKTFARAVIASALEGQTTYTEAYQLLGIRKAATFDEFARQLGLML
jgi:Zn-dependent peptidase ImmA (M78 family)